MLFWAADPISLVSTKPWRCLDERSDSTRAIAPKLLGRSVSASSAAWCSRTCQLGRRRLTSDPAWLWRGRVLVRLDQVVGQPGLGILRAPEEEASVNRLEGGIGPAFDLDVSLASSCEWVVDSLPQAVLLILF